MFYDWRMRFTRVTRRQHPLCRQGIFA
jgi:hypothetical protein